MGPLTVATLSGGRPRVRWPQATISVTLRAHEESDPFGRRNERQPDRRSLLVPGGGGEPGLAELPIGSDYQKH